MTQAALPGAAAEPAETAFDRRLYDRFPTRGERPEGELEQLEAEDPGSERYQYVEGVLADMRELAIDADGRIVLPSDLAIHAGLGEEAAFVGRGSYQLLELSDR